MSSRTDHIASNDFLISSTSSGVIELIADNPTQKQPGKPEKLQRQLQAGLANWLGSDANGLVPTSPANTPLSGKPCKGALDRCWLRADLIICHKTPTLTALRMAPPAGRPFELT